MRNDVAGCKMNAEEIIAERKSKVILVRIGSKDSNTKVGHPQRKKTYKRRKAKNKVESPFICEFLPWYYCSMGMGF